MIRKTFEVVADMPTVSGSMRSSWKRDAAIITADRLAIVARIRELPGAMVATLVADQLEREIKAADK